MLRCSPAAVLRKVGEVLGAAVRQVDLAARYGGEEFAVILPESDLAAAVKVAERLRRDLMNAETELPDGTRTIAWSEVTISHGTTASSILAIQTPPKVVSFNTVHRTS